MKKLHLVFIPVITSSHLTSPIEFAKHLLDQNETLCITFLAILLPNQTNLDPGIESFAASNPRFRVIIVENTTNPLPEPSSVPISIEKLATLYIDSHKTQVEKTVTELLLDDSIQIAGFVLDLFCSSMIDVANKLDIPSYIFFTSNIAFLGFLLYLPAHHNEVAVEFQLSDADIVVPSYRIPVPTYALPTAVFDKTGGGYESFLYHGTKFKEAKGIIVNSFVELEPYAFDSVEAPSVYPVGPLIDHKKTDNSTNWIEIRNWLDSQRPKSVIFLCFGTHGSFNESQLEQMAIALERTGYPFLWSIRKPPPKGTNGPPSDYTNVEEVLPNGFLERVKRRGMVCGWAPQVDVLAHEAVKGFVSHCGWNSILESLWYGVPIATWPMHAEQQLNAFWLVKELGLAVELSLTYRSTDSELVMADQIEKAINCLMDNENPVHERVKKTSEFSRKALIKGGSSVLTLGKLVEDMLQNITEKRYKS